MNSLTLAFVPLYCVCLCVCIVALLEDIWETSWCTLDVTLSNSFYMLTSPLSHLSPLFTMFLLKPVIFYFDVVQYVKFSTQVLAFGYLVWEILIFLMVTSILSRSWNYRTWYWDETNSSPCSEPISNIMQILIAEPVIHDAKITKCMVSLRTQVWYGILVCLLSYMPHHSWIFITVNAGPNKNILT